MMINKVTRILITLVAVFLLGVVVTAQDATEAPADADTEATETIDMDNGDAETGETDGLPNATATLEDIAANSADYYGQVVTVEGGVETFLNAKTFVLGEEALIDNDQVLVFNMSNEHFDIRVTKEADVVVTGTILPSIAVRNDGVSELDFWDPIDVPESATYPAFYTNPLQFHYDGGLEDGYDVYTILVVEDVSDIAVSFQELDDIDEIGDSDGLDEDEIDDTEDMEEATEESGD